MDEEKFFAGETIKDKSKKQEKRVAKKIRGRTTIGSGNLRFDKADVYKRGLRIECKRTDKKSIILDKDWFDKLKGECLSNEIPALNIQIQDQDWYMIRPEEFEIILEYLEGK